MAINNCVGRDIVVSTNTNVSGDISMKTFSPTYLYIKQHSVTGKLYFGKTKNNPEKYLGSGTYWLNHINKHGKEHVVTLWYCLFLNKPELVDFATAFSTEQCIVESTTWANLAIETGLDGGYSQIRSLRGTVNHDQIFVRYGLYVTLYGRPIYPHNRHWLIITHSSPISCATLWITINQ